MSTIKRLHPKSLKGDIFVAPEILLGEERIVFLRGVIGPVTADMTPIGPVIAGDDIVVSLTQLDRESDTPIKLVINSPGGSVTDGLLIADTVQMLRSPLWTFVFSASSFGAIIAVLGEKGHRYVMPSSEMFLHSSIVEVSGKDEDVEVAREYQKRLRNRVYDILISRTELVKREPQIRAETSVLTGKSVAGGDDSDSLERVAPLSQEDATRKALHTYLGTNRYYSAEMAKRVGLVDEIVTPDIFHTFFNVPRA